MDFRLSIIFGILTFSSLVTTVFFGLIYHRFKRPVFRYHRFFAFLTLALALIHIFFVLSIYYF